MWRSAHRGGDDPKIAARCGNAIINLLAVFLRMGGTTTLAPMTPQDTPRIALRVLDRILMVLDDY